MCQMFISGMVLIVADHLQNSWPLGIPDPSCFIDCIVKELVAPERF